MNSIIQEKNQGMVSPGQGDRLKIALARLKEWGIEASAVISRDGTLISVFIPAGEEHKIFAPMYAAMLAAAEQATSELRLGVPRRVVMEIGDRKLVAVGAGPLALMVALVGEKAQYPKINAEIDRTAAEVKAILATP